MSSYRGLTPDESWERDDIQFPRLLAELVAVGAPTNAQMLELCASMDLTPALVNELLDRAQLVWERIKDETR